MAFVHRVFMRILCGQLNRTSGALSACTRRTKRSSHGRELTAFRRPAPLAFEAIFFCPMPEPGLADLLQSYESVLETLKRVVAVANRMTAAIRSGESLSPNELAEYERQLSEVEKQRLRLEQLLAAWWQLSGHDRPN